ncbi:MAG: TolC family protein [Coprobacter sp.]|nr:TolC family protein [Coprobacter sp.]
MKKFRFFIISSYIGLFSGQTLAQEKPRTWTLESCLQYAYEQNIELKKGRLSIESSEIDTRNAKAQLFPSLSAGVSYQLTNSPFIETGISDLDNYIVTGNSGSNKNQFTGSYNLRGSLTLFNGGKLLNQIKSQKVAQQMQELSLEESFDNIESAIVSAYLQILYARESVRINENTVEVSKAQCERGEKLYVAGSLSASDYAQLSAQYSNDKYQLVVSQNTLEQNILTLKQLLELDIDDTLAIETPVIEESDILMPLASKSEIYYTALACMPTIKNSELGITAAKLDLKSAKAGYYPTLSLSAGISTGHLSSNDNGVGAQLKNKLSESIGVSLSIPIYSNRNTRTAVSKARIAITSSELELQSTQKALLSDIESLYLDTKAAQEQYVAAGEEVKATEASYSLMQQKFDSGMANTLELLTEKNNMLAARQKVLQAKYMAILNRLLLNIYQNKAITL